MKFNIQIKPRIVEARTIGELKRKLHDNYGYCTSSTYGNGIHVRRGGRMNDDVKFIRVYNIEKHRPVKEQRFTKAKSNVYNGDNGTIRKTKIVKEGFARAYVYDIPADMFAFLGIKVKQDIRSFTLVDKNKNSVKASEIIKKVA